MDRKGTVNLFRRSLRGFIVDLKVIQDEHLKGSKVTPDMFGDIEEIRLQCNFLHEEKDRKGRLVFEDLVGSDSFSEATEIITNLCWQARDAMEHPKSRAAKGFEVRLFEAINRLSDLEEDERNEGLQMTAGNESGAKIQQADIDKVYQAARQGAHEGRGSNPTTWTAAVERRLFQLKDEEKRLPSAKRRHWKGIVTKLKEEFPGFDVTPNAAKQFHSSHVRSNTKP